MNLSTAQFTRRLKEASVRKILGLGKKELGLGYFLEALAFCLLAMMIAIGLTQLLLPSFNLITGRALQLNLIESPEIILGLTGLVLLMALVSGIYPAAFLSGFHPVEAIKGKVKTGRAGKSFRDGLVVFQFSISIVLILCTAIVYQQLNYVADKDLGFNRENLLVLNHVEAIKDGESIATAALTIPGVLGSTLCTSVPPRIWGGDSFGVEEKSELRFPLNFLKADEQYIPTLQVELVVGRNFSTDNPGDYERVLVNEATIHKIGWEVNDEMVKQAVGTMSGGEKARLVLCMLVWQSPNLLLMDEPTNHLDLANREALSVALNEFEGTVMLVSHARALLRSVCEEFWLVSKGDIGPFDGDLEDYQRYLLEEAKRAREEAAAAHKLRGT